MCSTLAPQLEAAAWTLDRVHRLPRPARFTADTPKDVIARFHYYTSKEAIFSSTRKMEHLPEPYQKISIYADISVTTMAKRREFINITKTLRNHQVPYRWGYPTKLLIWHRGKTEAILEPEAGMAKLKEWGLHHNMGHQSPQKTQLKKMRAEWSMVGSPSHPNMHTED
ncbi:Hypothetical predicted protein [Pelobates cultripes]|uniref:Uncharacterized protein n=1 Tax=Pelobates cultripes TaxID=61616 RepID=A0AAD1RPY0_PELCU|nr:Hypothetical predicted protein [Pelobates cultripes]